MVRRQDASGKAADTRKIQIIKGKFNLRSREKGPQLHADRIAVLLVRNGAGKGLPDQFTHGDALPREKDPLERSPLRAPDEAHFTDGRGDEMVGKQGEFYQ